MNNAAHKAGGRIILGQVAGRLSPRYMPAPPLPLAQFLMGRSLPEAAALLPRLFNLCPMAQASAARISLGMVGADDAALHQSLCAEIQREHGLKLAVHLPLALGLPSAPPSAGFAARPSPRDMTDFAPWMASDGIGPALARAIAERFAPGEAVADGDRRADNSPAQRRADHPLMRGLAEAFGRGPMWRLMGIILDAAAAAAGNLPRPTLQADGTAQVPAARGTYSLRLTHHAGRITGLMRRTPTDDQLAAGGPLLRALATLPSAKIALAPVVLALHDPCIAITLCEAADA